VVSSCATALEQRDCLVIKRTNSSDRQLKLPDLRTTTTRTVYSVRTVSKVNIFRFGIKLHTRGRLYRISIFTIQIALTPKVCYSNRFFPCQQISLHLSRCHSTQDMKLLMHRTRGSVIDVEFNQLALSVSQWPRVYSQNFTKLAEQFFVAFFDRFRQR
jgi:hypothetical protein